MIDDSNLSEPDRRRFRSLRNRAEQIGAEEAELTDDYETAVRATRQRIKQETGSIITMILIGLLVKAAVEIIWAILTRKHPSKYTGSPPPIEFDE